MTTSALPKTFVITILLCLYCANASNLISLYASPNGSDTADCTSSTKPCSLTHAIEVATDKSEMKIILSLSGGTYAQTTGLLLEGFVEITIETSIFQEPAILTFSYSSFFVKTSKLLLSNLVFQSCDSSALVVDDLSTVTIMSTTFLNNTASEPIPSGNEHQTYGGAAIRSNSPLLLMSVNFTGNYIKNTKYSASSVAGSIIYCTSNISFILGVIDQNELTGSYDDVKGGIMYSEENIFLVSVEITNNRISGSFERVLGGVFHCIEEDSMASLDNITGHSNSIEVDYNNGNFVDIEGGIGYAYELQLMDSDIDRNSIALSGNFYNATANGGAFSVSYFALLTDSVISNNFISIDSSNFGTTGAYSSGGAIYIEEEAFISNVTFTSNYISVVGSSIAVTLGLQGGALSIGDADIDESNFIGNFISGTGGSIFSSIGGGAIFSSDSIALTDSDFLSNSAVSGGALFLQISNETAVIIDGCSFENSTATGTDLGEGGGAIYAISLLPTFEYLLFISDSVFEGNQATYGNDIYTVNTGYILTNSGTPDIYGESGDIPASVALLFLLFLILPFLTCCCVCCCCICVCILVVVLISKKRSTNVNVAGSDNKEEDLY